MLQTPHQGTPKRKRDEHPTLSPVQFSFELAATAERADEDGSNSPRSKVAHKFRGLALQGGGGAATDADEPELRDIGRKRQRPDDQSGQHVFGAAYVPRAMAMEEQDGTEGDKPATMAPEPQPPAGLGLGLGIGFAGSPGSDVTATTAAPPKLEFDLHPAYPPINRLSNSKARSKVKKRATSPPLRAKRLPVPEDDDDGEDDPVVIVDPVRAALTWREDEITVYDPEDEDDDGTGVNGIGFRPTPALAAARAMRRRQQMAEYRKREAIEARSRRSQRRQKGSGKSLGSGEKSPPRKVRFTDSDAKNIAVTTI